MLKGSNPLAWSHAGYGLEVTEKRRLGAEARRRSDCHYLHVWLLAQQFLSMTYTEFVDKLRESLTTDAVDALADVTAIGAETHGHILKFQVGAQVEMFLLHKRADTFHEFDSLAINRVLSSSIIYYSHIVCCRLLSASEIYY